MKTKSYFAELLGTFILTFAIVSSSILAIPIHIPIIAGVTLGLLVYTMGGVSGGYFNPAVTAGMAAIKKISVKDAAIYIIFQICGAFLAMLSLKVLVGTMSLPTSNSILTGAGEAIGAFILAFGVAAVATKKVNDDASGLVVGGSLFLGIVMAVGMSNGILNPAVAIGIGSISWMYIFAPFVGGILAALTYKFVTSKD